MKKNLSPRSFLLYWTSSNNNENAKKHTILGEKYLVIHNKPCNIEFGQVAHEQQIWILHEHQINLIRSKPLEQPRLKIEQHN